MAYSAGSGAALVLALCVMLAGPVARAASDPPSADASPAGDGAPAQPPLAQTPAPPPAPTAKPGKGILYLSATFGPNNEIIRSGMHWRVYTAATAADGSRPLIAESRDATPALPLPDGEFIVHAAYGYAGVTRRVVIRDNPASERVVLNAGAVAVQGLLGDNPIAPPRLSIAVYVPVRGNSEAKLVVANAHPNDLLRLPEGTYHLVSTLLDTLGVGSLNPSNNVTNSVVTADIKVQAGKLETVTMRHRAATLTMKLVNAPGGEALANASFTVLTPGGDVIRELIGAFPSLVLAEGDYVVIARHEGKVYPPTDFKVQTALDRDIEVIAK